MDKVKKKFCGASRAQRKRLCRAKRDLSSLRMNPTPDRSDDGRLTAARRPSQETLSMILAASRVPCRGFVSRLAPAGGMRALGSFSTEAAGSDARPTFASPRKLTPGSYEKSFAMDHEPQVQARMGIKATHCGNRAFGLDSASDKKCAGRSPGGEMLHAQGFVFAIRRARSS